MISPYILAIGSATTLPTLNAVLAGTAYRVEESTPGTEAIFRVSQDPVPDLVLLELGNGGRESLPMLQQLHAMQPDLAIVVLAASNDTRQVVEAIRLGARDYLSVPLQPTELQRVLLRHLGAKAAAAAPTDPGETIEELDDGNFFLAASPAMHKVRIQAGIVANLDVPLLILGESGTGKEVIAHLIHKLSSRSKKKFLKVNCAALTGDLLDSELFGWERGAITGATRRKPGMLEMCDKGTILLDEVAEMSAHLQAKLLQVLEDKQFFRLGGEHTVEVDVRILATTSTDVHQAILKRTFREDLYYRLSAFAIVLPPLREREGEIPLMLRHLMARMGAQYSRPPLRLSPALIEACLRYPWPGNLRELENFVKRYPIMVDEAAATAELSTNWRPKQTAVLASSGSRSANVESVPGERQPRGSNSSLRKLRDEAEANAIMRTLEETRWNRKRAAGLLNISYRGLLYKVHRHGILRPSGATPPHFRGHKTL
jgi:DNA-binding NtrC family response regulator